MEGLGHFSARSVSETSALLVNIMDCYFAIYEASGNSSQCIIQDELGCFQ